MAEDNLQNVHPLVPGGDAPVLGARLHLLEPVFSFCELRPTATATSCQRFRLILGALRAHLEGCFFAPFLEIGFADQVSQLLPGLLGRVKYQPCGLLEPLPNAPGLFLKSNSTFKRRTAILENYDALGSQSNSNRDKAASQHMAFQGDCRMPAGVQRMEISGTTAFASSGDHISGLLRGWEL